MVSSLYLVGKTIFVDILPMSKDFYFYMESETLRFYTPIQPIIFKEVAHALFHGVEFHFNQFLFFKHLTIRRSSSLRVRMGYSKVGMICLIISL